MKLLFIRFFVNKNDTIPHDSFPICKSTDTKTQQEGKILDKIAHLFDWTNQHPDGKVDLVWL